MNILNETTMYIYNIWIVYKNANNISKTCLYDLDTLNPTFI